MFSRVLIAVDGSECARRAAAVGVELAATAGAAVEVVHVVEERAERDAEGADAPDPREYGWKALQPVESESGPDVDSALLDGRPSAAIVERATDRGADLIVLGRRGHSNLGERLLGSTVERVLRRTEIPVLAVPDVPGAEPGGYENVLVTTDGSEAAERAGPYGAAVARMYGATLHLLSVLDLQSEAGPFDAGGVSRSYVERLRSFAREDVEALAESVDADDLDVVEDVVRGRPHEGIREYVDEAEIDLVAMASQGQTRLTGRILGSTTDRVLRTASIPVLVVPVP